MATAQLQPSNIPPMKLKLIINKHTQQLLFAEVDENFVDFLFKIPSLPVCTFLNLFKGTGDVNPSVVGGSLGNLFHTIENFDKSNSNKVMNYTAVQLWSPLLMQQQAYLNMMNNRTRMHNDSNIHSANSFPRTVVKAGRYMVMDDLSVELMTSISSLDRFNKFGVSNSKNLEEKEVEFGKDKVIFFFKEILMTKNVLSSVFLGNKYNNCDDANDYVMADHISSMQPSQG